MKYCRFRRTDKVDHAVYRARLARLSGDRKKAHRRNTLRNGFASVCFLLVWMGGTGVIAGLLSQLIPKTENAFLAILISIGFVLLFLIFSILMFVAAAFVAKPLWSKSEPAVFRYCREDAASGCLHLRRYYRLEKPYLLTKCYDSSIKGFVDHDICLFFVEGDLRLTVDLVNGFTHGWKDLGCYTLQLDELSLSNVKIGSREALELKAGKIWFLLGKRARGFIQRAFRQKACKAGLYEAVKRELDQFDAHGLLAMHCPPDEFEEEARMIAQRLQRDMDISQIAAIMAEVMETQFDDHFAEKDFFVHAKAIKRFLIKN